MRGVFVSLLRCRALTRWRSGMAQRPNPLYPRFESVDLGEDGAPPEDKAPRGIDFEDHASAFRSKTTWEIVRALAVLRICSLDCVVDNSLGLMRWVERVLGGGALRLLFKPTLYAQFVGGEDADQIRGCVRKLSESGMRAMLAATMEEDVGEGGEESVYQKNCERILQSIEIAVAEDTPSPMIQLKLSGLLQAELLVMLGNRYSGSSDKLKLIQAVARGLTGQEIDMSPFADAVDAQKREALDRAVQRLRKIGTAAQQQGVKVLVDAEYSYLNPGLSLLALAAAAAFNKRTPVVWNTYQCYLKEARQKVSEESGLVLRGLQACFGAKVVRGAYMVQERARAQRLHVADPVCEDYAATGKNYDMVISELLEKTSELGSRCQLIIASHNEESVKWAIQRMVELGIDKERGGVSFGQLYGMCDQVTNPLAAAGFAVYKSIPYGTVGEVLPYLARRAVENRSVLEGARKEKTLLNKELKRRITRKFCCGRT